MCAPHDEDWVVRLFSGSNEADGENLIDHFTIKAEAVKEEQCRICLNTIKVGDAIRRLPCMHAFHAEEIEQWLQINARCPTCKNSINNVDISRALER